MTVRTKIGDIFSVTISNTEKKSFQLIAFDQTQLNSDVIRVFRKGYGVDVKPELDVIVADDTEFYSHCSCDLGIKHNFWDKAGNTKNVGRTDHILFRDTPDYGNREIKISEKWWVWKINEPQKFVGKLEYENCLAEIGLVFAPQRILNRIKTGSYSIPYPGYE